MIIWDSEEVARFFGVQPERPHDEDTELVFTFDSDGRDVHLTIQPYNDYAVLAIARREETRPHVELRMHCVSIVVDDPSDNPSPSLILSGLRSTDLGDEDGAHLRYWIRVVPAEGTFAIESNFAQQFDDDSAERARSEGRGRSSGCLIVLLAVTALLIVIAILISMLGAL